MASIGSGYDLSVSTYSPDGRLYQIEYAAKAVDNSPTAIGIRCVDGVVLALEKLVISNLMTPGKNKRILSVDKHVGVATTGYHADGRQLVLRAREDALNWTRSYSESISGATLAEALGMFSHAYTLYSSVRPFGAAAIIGSMDEGELPRLYLVETSGEVFGYRGVAVGKGKQLAKTEIEKVHSTYNGDKGTNILDSRRGVLEAVRILRKVHEDNKEKQFEIEVSWICTATGGRHEHVPDSLLTEAEEYAIQSAQLDEDDEMEE